MAGYLTPSHLSFLENGDCSGDFQWNVNFKEAGIFSVLLFAVTSAKRPLPGVILKFKEVNKYITC